MNDNITLTKPLHPELRTILEEMDGMLINYIDILKELSEELSPEKEKEIEEFLARNKDKIDEYQIKVDEICK